MKEPQIKVGILMEPRIEFELLAPYKMWGTYCNGVVTHHRMVTGKQVATHDKGKIHWEGYSYDTLSFEPMDAGTDAFELIGVTIGIDFHWERKENQRFLGELTFVVEDEKLTAINVIGVEDYLTSVISSEMSATASLELLKAHAVISRSWLLQPLALHQEEGTTHRAEQGITSNAGQEGEYIKWYDRSAHTHFDVCADDHCQRYQGITKASTPQATDAVCATRGQVLLFEGEICDTRYSKCCGGALEEFPYCWEEVRHPYLSKQRDSKSTTVLPDLRIEAEAERWIRTSPEAFCNTQDKKVLSQVLNNYDQETTHFYRWQVEYTQQELSELVKQRSGIDYGLITDLIPVERGVSGRLVKLKIVGTSRTLTIGKELEIRRTLSTSHLYSSAFVVDKEGDRFILTGAGWGHGVGLCQIGAAMMGEQGYTYDEILLHYYASPKERGTEIVTLYK